MSNDAIFMNSNEKKIMAPLLKTIKLDTIFRDNRKEKNIHLFLSFNELIRFFV